MGLNQPGAIFRKPKRPSDRFADGMLIGGQHPRDLIQPRI